MSALDRYGDRSHHLEQLLAVRTFLDYLPDDPAGVLVLGVQSYFTGDLPGARLRFQRLLELDPEDLVAQKFLTALEAREAKER